MGVRGVGVRGMGWGDGGEARCYGYVYANDDR